MRLISYLLRSDLLAIKRWYSYHTISRLTVLAGFVAISLLTSFSIFASSHLFFGNLSEFSSYGSLTADYIVKGAFVIMAWLAFGSAIATSSAWLLKSSPEQEYLTTLPLQPKIIFRYMQIKTFVIHALLLFVIMVPILFAYHRVFDHLTFLSLTTITLSLFLLLVTTQALGTAIAFILTPFLKKLGPFWTVITIAFVFIFSALAITRLIFPKSLLALYRSQPDQFLSLYSNLPLNTPYLPTNWLATSATRGFTDLAYLSVALTLLILELVDLLLTKRFSRLVQTLQVHSPSRLSSRNFLARHLVTGTVNPSTVLTLKDLLGLIRTSSEIGYSIFLLLLSTFFFLMLGQAGGLRPIEAKFANQLIAFCLLWLFFFASAYLLRLVFPLIATENNSAWATFTKPIKPHLILRSKLLTGLIISLPLFFLAKLVWLYLPFAHQHFLLLESVSLWTILLIFLVISFLGAIHPNFSLGDNPERVSTSPTGLIALISVASLSIAQTITTTSFLSGSISINPFIAFNLLLIPFILVLTLTALHAVKHYSFP